MNCPICRVPVVKNTEYCANHLYFQQLKAEVIDLAEKMEVSLEISTYKIVATPPEGWRFRGFFRKTVTIRRYLRSEQWMWTMLETHLKFGLRRTQ